MRNFKNILVGLIAVLSSSIAWGQSTCHHTFDSTNGSYSNTSTTEHILVTPFEAFDAAEAFENIILLNFSSMLNNVSGIGVVGTTYQYEKTGYIQITDCGEDCYASLEIYQWQDPIHPIYTTPSDNGITNTIDEDRGGKLLYKVIGRQDGYNTLGELITVPDIPSIASMPGEVPDVGIQDISTTDPQKMISTLQYITPDADCTTALNVDNRGFMIGMAIAAAVAVPVTVACGQFEVLGEFFQIGAAEETGTQSFGVRVSQEPYIDPIVKKNNRNLAHSSYDEYATMGAATQTAYEINLGNSGDNLSIAKDIQELGADCAQYIVKQPVYFVLTVKNCRVLDFGLPGQTNEIYSITPQKLFCPVLPLVGAEGEAFRKDANTAPTVFIDKSEGSEALVVQGNKFANKTTAPKWIDNPSVKFEVWGKLLIQDAQVEDVDDVDDDGDVTELIDNVIEINEDYTCGLWLGSDMVCGNFVMTPSCYWGDTVFETDYHLPDLQTVEAFIKKNRHLEGIPTQSDVEKKGYSQRDITVNFLKKIEELALYKIDQHNLTQDNFKQLEENAKRIENIKAMLSKN